MIGPVLTPVILPITQMALTGSVYSVVAVAVERYFNICKPFDRNRVGVMDGFGYILGIVIFSFSYNIIKFFELKTVYNTSYDNTTNISTTQPNVELTSLRKNPVYVNTYIVCNTIIMGVFPLFLLWLLNWRIIAAMQLATRRHNNISSLQRYFTL
ncbi:FMRFamide receptor isoform X2 [Eurytemora carolleeae]|uniref:FMRFamide receptor isoform X2 n=1 Tax=Eurytemora carolleeae TaxID=1294199 RepID=UPI000C78FE39|nr:FMRFamide receptor isoform X2 [Eurytemora carolleeae]|eukprot:XP_023347656.1 FMRFamide receptor-like isoform X2 [Eurytemora affinis]